MYIEHDLSATKTIRYHIDRISLFTRLDDMLSGFGTQVL